MKNKKKLKEYNWFHANFYALMVRFFFKPFVVEQFIEKIDSEKKVLEIGSGTGNDFKILKKTYDVTGSDYSDSFLKILRRKFKNETFLKLNALTMDVNEKFDVIYSNKVLHHFTPEQLRISLKNQYNCLNEDGQVFHALWHGTNKRGAYKDMPDVRYELTDIEALKGDFRIKEFITYKEMTENDSFIVILEK